MYAMDASDSEPDFRVKQWEFQVGPSVGISAGDEIWVARYILEVRFAATVWKQSNCDTLLLPF